MASDIFTLNTGSSSLKFSVWRAATGLELGELLRGKIKNIGIAPHLSARKPGGRAVVGEEFAKGDAALSHDELVRALLVRLVRDHGTAFKAIGHRIVHGGAIFKAPVRICSLCGWLGVALDERANGSGQMRIATKASRVAVYLIPTDEERMIAEHAVRCIV